MAVIKKGNIKRDKLKAEVLELASEQFRIHGLKAVKMDDIAAKMRISKRTLYEIYDNKEQIIIDSIIRYSENLRAHLVEYAKSVDNVMDILLEFFRYQIDSYTATNPLYFKELAKNSYINQTMIEHKEKMNRDSLKFFELGVSEGYFVSAVTYPLLLEATGVLFREMRVNSAFEGYKPYEVFRSIVCVILRGICTQKGLEKIDEFVNRFDEEYNS